MSLRSCSLGSLGALGPACCSILSELSEEQAFHVSYLDIGMAGWGGRGMLGTGPEQVQMGIRSQGEHDDDVDHPPGDAFPPNTASLLSLGLQRS